MEEELIICPWCQSITFIGEDENEFQCSVCERIITEEDIEVAIDQNEK